MSPGLAKMTARAAAAVPFARAAGLLAELAGIGLTVKRVERCAEADGAAAAAAISARGRRDPARQLIPCPARLRLRTCSTWPSTAPACR